MVAISTLLLAANLLAWVLNGTKLFSFWWNVLAYGVEILIYLIIFITIALITP